MTEVNPFKAGQDNSENAKPAEDQAQKLAEEEALKDIMKQAESLWLTDKFVDRPCTVIIVGFLIIVFFIVLCLSLESYYPSPVTSRDLLDFSDINTQMYDAREATYFEIQ